MCRLSSSVICPRLISLMIVCVPKQSRCSLRSLIFFFPRNKSNKRKASQKELQKAERNTLMFERVYKCCGIGRGGREIALWINSTLFSAYSFSFPLGYILTEFHCIVLLPCPKKKKKQPLGLQYCRVPKNGLPKNGQAGISSKNKNDPRLKK